MTESMIELRAERMMDSLDRRYMKGELTDDEYLAEVNDIQEWTVEKYSNLLKEMNND